MIRFVRVVRLPLLLCALASAACTSFGLVRASDVPPRSPIAPDDVEIIGAPPTDRAFKEAGTFVYSEMRHDSNAEFEKRLRDAAAKEGCDAVLVRPDEARSLVCIYYDEPGKRRPKLAPEAAAVDTWRGLDWDARHDRMTWTVLPNIARAFQRYRGEAAPSLACVTCHGSDAEAVHYKMPHGLPALDPERLPRESSPDEREAKIARFMNREVVPEIRELMGSPSVSCFTCHPKKS
jgi:hypothetical protein